MTFFASNASKLFVEWLLGEKNGRRKGATSGSRSERWVGQFPSVATKPAFAQMAADLKLPQTDLESAHLALADFWRGLFAGDVP
jgi:hypothetical protein